MKKLSVLLLAAVVALGAAAGNKLVNPQMTKVNIKEAKAMSMTKKMLKRGDKMNVKGFALSDLTPSQSNRLTADGDYFWDFETEECAAEWTAIDNDGDGFNWEWIDFEGAVTHGGIGCISSASYDNPTYTILFPDNWLISPVVNLHGTLSFYYAGQDPSYAAEVFAVYVTTGDPTDLNGYEKISEDITASGTMKQFTYDLSAYEGMEGCIAIRHYNVSDMFRLNIDDVTIGEVEIEPEPETPTVITEIPEGCQTYTYYRNSGCIYYSWIYGIVGTPTDGKFTVAFDLTNGDVYIQNPSWYHDSYNSWVKGTYDWMTGIISVPTGQYLNWYDEYQYGVQLVWGSSYVYMDTDPETGEEGYYMGTEIDERTTEIQFMIDDDTIYLLGTSGDIYAEFPEWGNCEGMMTIWSDDQSWTSFEFANRDEYGYAQPFGQIVNLVPAVPADPTADEWSDCGDESGYSRFYFTLPTTDVDGNIIDPEYLSYSIFVDNGNGAELFTFPAVDYTFDLTTDITEVPYYLYSNAVDFRNYYCYFYRTNAEGYEPLFTENIGIQVYYTVNGERNASNIVWLYEQPEPTEKTDAPSSQKVNYVYNDGNLYYNAYTVTLIPAETEPNCDIYYRVGVLIDGVYEYGDWMLYTGELNFDDEGTYMVEAYAIAPNKTESDHIWDGFTVSKLVDVEEIMAGKTVANVRYFNVTGQEMAQPSGLTIQVTTYTDGTTSAVKVVK